MSKNLLRAATILVAVAMGCSSGDGSTGAQTPTAGTSSEASTSGGGPTTSKGSAPDFTLRSLDGKNVSLSDHLGKKVILLDFWATTCAPCLVEMPHVVKMYEKYKDKGFIVLAVASEGPDTSANIPGEVHSKKMTFPVLLDEDTSVIAVYNGGKTDLPLVVLIDKNGNIVKKKQGFDPGDEVKLAEEIEKLL